MKKIITKENITEEENELGFLDWIKNLEYVYFCELEEKKQDDIDSGLYSSEELEKIYPEIQENPIFKLELSVDWCGGFGEQYIWEDEQWKEWGTPQEMNQEQIKYLKNWMKANKK